MPSINALLCPAYTSLHNTRDQLATAIAAEKTLPDLWHVAKRRVDDRLGAIGLELALFDKLFQVAGELGPLGDMVGDGKACSQHASERSLTLHGDAVADNLGEVAIVGLVAVVTRNRAAHTNKAMPGSVRKHGIENVAADVFIHPVGKLAFERLGEIGVEVAGLVVDARVGPEVLNDPLALFRTTSNADNALGASYVLGELDGDGSDGTEIRRET